MFLVRSHSFPLVIDWLHDDFTTELNSLALYSRTAAGEDATDQTEATAPRGAVLATFARSAERAAAGVWLPAN